MSIRDPRRRPTDMSRFEYWTYFVRHPFDWWWVWGAKGTTYWMRVGTLRIPVWRTRGMPYEVRRG